MWGRIGAGWGLGGVVALLVYAVVRLSLIAAEALQYPFDLWQWTLLLANAVFMAHSEGYKGFQKGYAPRVVARARYLLETPRPLLIVLAPLFCMGYFHATRRRLLTTYLLTVGIVILIVVFHQLPQPWRGILDFGVVVGLSWGIASIVAFSIRAFGRKRFDASPEVPHTPDAYQASSVSRTR